MPIEAYRQGYEKGRSDTAGRRLAEVTMGMLRDDPGGHFQKGYRDGAASRSFDPPSTAAPNRVPSKRLIPRFSESPVEWLLAVLIIVELWVLWQLVKAPFQLIGALVRSEKPSPWVIIKNLILAALAIALIWWVPRNNEMRRSGTNPAPVYTPAMTGQAKSEAQLSSPTQNAVGLAFPPRDDGTGDPSLVEFRNGLLSAVRQKDEKYLASVVSADFRWSFGGESSWSEFLNSWKVGDPTSELWDELEIILTHGGCFSEGQSTFSAPYTFCAPRPASADSEGSAAVIEDREPLRSAPSSGASVQRLLSYEFVRLQGGEDAHAEYRKVTAGNGEVGYIRRRAIRHAYDARAILEKRSGQWVLVGLFRGD